MRKILIFMFVFIILIFTACNKIDTEIDLTDLKSDTGDFCYKDLYLNSSLDEAKKVVGYEFQMYEFIKEQKLEIYHLEEEFKLLDCIGEVRFEFENSRLNIIQFTFNNPNDDVEAMYIELIAKLEELYSDATETFDNSGENELGKMQSVGSRWDIKKDDYTTVLNVGKLKGDKTKTVVSLVIGLLP